MLRLCIFYLFPSGTEFLGVVFGVFPLRSHYGRKLHFNFLFFSSTFSLLCISVNRNFYSRFIIHFRFYRTYYVAQQLGNKDTLNIRRFTISKGLHSLVKLANIDGLKQTRVGNATLVLHTSSGVHTVNTVGSHLKPESYFCAVDTL